MPITSVNFARTLGDSYEMYELFSQLRQFIKSLQSVGAQH